MLLYILLFAFFSWEPSTSSDVAGYRIYIGEESRLYNRVVNTGNVTEFSVDLPFNKRLFSSITAYDYAGNESGFSEEISFLIRKDGTIIRFDNSGLKLIITPNPVTYSALIEKHGKQDYFKIYNILGQTIYKDKSTNETVRWVPELSIANGTYIAMCEHYISTLFSIVR